MVFAIDQQLDSQDCTWFQHTSVSAAKGELYYIALQQVHANTATKLNFTATDVISKRQTALLLHSIVRVCAQGETANLPICEHGEVITML
jgi:hypothetical protein